MRTRGQRARWVGLLALGAVCAAGGTGCKDRDTTRVSKNENKSSKQEAKQAPDIPEKGPLAQKVLYERAKGLLRAGQPAQAEAAFRRAIEADPGGKLAANCHLGLGSALAEQGQHRQAVAVYKQVVRLAPTDPEAYRALAIGQEEAGDHEGAIENLGHALALDPDQLSAYQDLAGLHLRRKDVENAKDAYTRYELRRTALIRTLGLSKSVERRVEAAQRLGDARDEATVKALGLALTDRDARVREAVIRALARQGLKAGEGPLRALIARSQDEKEKRLASQALEAIAAAPPPGPIPEPPAPSEEPDNETGEKPRP